MTLTAQNRVLDWTRRCSMIALPAKSLPAPLMPGAVLRSYSRKMTVGFHLACTHDERSLYRLALGIIGLRKVHTSNRAMVRWISFSQSPQPHRCILSGGSLDVEAISLHKTLIEMPWPLSTVKSVRSTMPNLILLEM